MDRLTIVAHDKFDEIIKAASNESSIIRKENIIVIEDDDDMGREKEVVTSNTVFSGFIAQQEQRLKYARSEQRKQEIDDEIRAAQAVGEAIEEVLSQPVNIVVSVASASKQPDAVPASPVTKEEIITSRDLHKPEVQQIIREKAKEKLTSKGSQVTLGISDIDKKIEQAIAPLVEQKIRFTIDIPDVALISKDTQRMIYRDFDLDTKWGFDFTAPSEEIVIESLQDNTVSTLEADTGVILSDTPENLIIAQILNMDSMIDYDEAAEILYKLAGQALA